MCIYSVYIYIFTYHIISYYIMYYIYYMLQIASMTSLLNVGQFFALAHLQDLQVA